MTEKQATNLDRKVTCTATLTTGEICGRKCFMREDGFMYSGRGFWACPTHGQEKLLSEPTRAEGGKS